MGKLKILLGPSGSGKTTALFREVIEKAGKDIRTNHIVIVPEQVSHAVTEKLIEMSPRKGIINIDVLSFNRLAHRIFDNAGSNSKEIIDDTDKNLILKTVVSEHEDELTVLKKCAHMTGCINEIKSVISEFVQYEAGPEDIRKTAENTENRYLAAKLRDIYIIFKAFREKIAEKYVTREELLDRAAEAAERADFLKGAHLYFDDFTGFTPIQYRFLSSVIKYSGSVSLCLDYDGCDGDLFSMSVDTIGKIRDMASEAGFEIETIHFYDNKDNRFKDSPALGILEKNLFRRNTDERSGNTDLTPGQKEKAAETGSGSIRIVKCLKPEKEAEFVISGIQELVRSGLRYRDIGIVMSSPEEYGYLLQAEAEKQGLPIFIDSTTEILLNPYTEFIRSAIEAVAENLSYEAVFHFVRSGLSPLSIDEGDRLENYVRAMNIRGRKRYSEPFRIHVRRMKEEDLGIVNDAREKLVKVLAPLSEAGGRGKKTARIFTEALKDFIAKSGVKVRMQELVREFKEKGILDNADAYDQIPEKTDELLSRIESLMPEEKMNLREYLEILSAGFEAIRIGVLPSGMDTVRAGDTERSRIGDIRVLFFMGMNDGLIPKTGISAGILSDPDRELLKEKGMELSPTARERIGVSRLYFYMNATKPSEKLIFTYSAGGGDGKERIPSFFLNEVRAVFPGLKDEIFREKENIFTKRDLLTMFSDSLRVRDRKQISRELYACISRDEKEKLLADRIVDHAFMIHGEDRITEALSKAVYGDEKNLSPTRLERYAECAYRYFMLYGLRAMEREEFGFERRDLGNVLHSVLNICSDLIREKGLKYGDLSDSEAELLSEEALQKYLRENENVVLLSSDRNKYFINRMSRILKTTVHALKTQSGKGSFNPGAFEKEFKGDGFFGRIDRIDTAESGSKVYVSVIDYKSGNKAFDLSRVYYALDLQLVIYLNGALELTRVAYPGKEVKSAGIFYYHIDDPVIKESDLNSGSDEEIEEKIMDSLKLRGIVNSDPEVIRLFDSNFEKKSSVVPVSFNKDGSFSANSSVASQEEFRVISEHIRRKSSELREEMEKGVIDPSPKVFDKKSPCEYCEFSDCCRFDKGIPGFKEQRLKKIKSNSEIISLMEPEEPEEKKTDKAQK